MKTIKVMRDGRPATQEELQCAVDGKPLPATTGYPSGIEAEVCADILARQTKGILKYGVTVADNPLPLKAWLQHALEECYDQAVYLKRAIREMENTELTDRRGADSVK